MLRQHKLLITHGHTWEETQHLLLQKSAIQPNRLVHGGTYALYFRAKNPTLMANGMWVINRAASMRCDQVDWDGMFAETIISAYGQAALYNWLNSPSLPDAERNNIKLLVVNELIPDYILSQGEFVDLPSTYAFAGDYYGRLQAYDHFKGLIDNVFVGDTVLHAYEVRP